MDKRTAILVVFAAFLLGCVTVSGTVRYSSLPLAGFQVDLVRGDLVTGTTRSVDTDVNGRYKFEQVPQGPHWVRVNGDGIEYIGWIAEEIAVGTTDITLDKYLPKIIALASPADDAVDVGTQPTLTWADNPEASAGGHYEVQINETGGGLVQLIDPTSPTNSYTVDVALEPGTNYTWQVDAYDVNGNHVGTTDLAFTFEVGALVLQPGELCSAHPAAAIATFEDPNLEAAVRAALGVGPQEDLTCGLISGLTSLSASSSGITSLVGIQNLTSLVSLLLGVNSITDINALSGLASLTWLSLIGNGLSNIGALSGLTNLTKLGLSNNSISDISALSTLTSLTNLTLNLNAITDASVDRLSELSGLTNLTSLNLSENPGLGDIEGLRGLTSLTFLSLSGLSLSNIEPLSGLTNLSLLQLFNSSIVDISALSGLTNLTNLFLRNNTILSNIQPLLDNTGLGAGDAVDLTHTAVICADITALEAQGVTVTSDCP